MKKTLKITVLCCALALLLGLEALAAETLTSAGFYRIRTVSTVAVSLKDESGTPVKVSLANVDTTNDAGGITYECFFPNSSRLTVTYSGATVGKQYLIFLTAGTTIPTVSDALYYIDQIASETGTVVFEVNTGLLPTDRNTDMTLFITSDDGSPAVSVPLSYAVSGTYDVAPYILGDVDSSGKADIGDVTKLLRHLAKLDTLTTNQVSAGDVDGFGTTDIGDVTKLLRYLANFDELGK